MKTNRTKRAKVNDMWAAMIAEEAAMPRAEKDRLNALSPRVSDEDKDRVYGTSLRSEDLFHLKYGSR